MSTWQATSEEERLAWLRLVRTERIGPVSFFKLIRRYDSAVEALEHVPDLARRAGGAALKPAGLAAIERELAAGTAYGAQLLLWSDEGYPELLRHIPDPPPVMWVKGDTDLLSRVCVGLVGARNASGAGLTFASQVARELGQAHVCLVSGLARGIDSAVHAATLETGTVAVVAGGIDKIYPPENAQLHEAIANQGAIVAENAPGLTPRGKDFPRRNRIIAGLCRAVGVIEAAARSGTLITARLANEQGREVLATPGSPLDPRAAGCLKLIREGASLLTSADDILAALGSGPRVEARSLDDVSGLDEEVAMDDKDLDTARERIADLLSATPIGVDQLARVSGFSIPVINACLMELALAGRAEFEPGGAVRQANPEDVHAQAKPIED